MRFRAPEKLTLCFHAAKELRGLDLADQTCHFRILDQAHADTSLLSISSGNLASRLGVTHIDHDLFLTLFLAKEVTVQLELLIIPRHGSQPIFNLSLEAKKKHPISRSAVKRVSKRCGGRDKPFRPLPLPIYFPSNLFMKQR